MQAPFNLDVLSVGITTAGIGLLGFTVFFSNPKSVTNRTLLYFSLAAIAWSVVNLLPTYIRDPDAGLMLIRLQLFVASWFTYFFFQLAYFFPDEKMQRSPWFSYFLLPVTIFTSILTLTPAVFVSVIELAPNGVINKVQNGWGIAVFATLITSNVVGGLFIFSRKAIKYGKEHREYVNVLVGMLLTFALIFTFNFILPAFFGNSKYVSLGPVFILPFIALTTYAIIRHGFLHAKVLATQILTFVLSVTALIELIIARDPMTIAFRIAIFALTLGFGVFLIRSVLKEVEAREQIERLAEDLAHANERLRDLDKRKSEFISIASHQLRTPLTAIKGYSSMMLEGSFGTLTTDSKEAIERIFQSTLRLIMIIEDFLTISKIEQGQLTYNFAPVNIKDVVENIVKDMQTNVHDKGLTLRFEPPKLAADEFDVLADSGKIFQVLTNLVDNAIKYTPKGGITIRINRNSQANRVIVCIADTGVGMNEETKSKLFQKFSRAEDAFKINTSGSGLGLYVAQQIMQAHNGVIRVESPGVGKGTVFFVELPAL